jgi:hypothetical protein
MSSGYEEKSIFNAAKGILRRIQIIAAQASGVAICPDRKRAGKK